MNQETPSEEIQQEAQSPSKPDSKEELVPEVCRYKVLYGKTNLPIFFEKEDGKCFDCDTEQWLDKKPAVAEELQKRPITVQDFTYAIMHGLVDKPAYEHLLSKGLVTTHARKTYEQLEKIYNRLIAASQMQKSDQDDLEDLEDNWDELDLSDEDLKEQYPINSDEEYDMSYFDEFDGENQETDVVAEVYELATKMSVEPKLEAIIRKIVREELGHKEQSQEIESIESPINEQSI